MLIGTWANLTFSEGKLQRDLHKMEDLFHNLESAQLGSILVNTHIIRNDAKGAKNDMDEVKEMIGHVCTLVEAKPAESAWSPTKGSGDGKNTINSNKYSKDPAATQNADLLELQRRLRSPDQSTFRKDSDDFLAFEDKRVETWYRETGSANLIWLTGPPGVGKSYYAYSAFKYLERKKAKNRAILFFREAYGDFRELKDAISCMIHQIASRNPEFCHWVLSRLRGGTEQTDVKELWGLLFSCIHERHAAEVNLVFDGIDEACEKDRKTLIEFLSVVHDLFKGAETSHPLIRV